jgi:hypothetical protein
MKIKRPGEGAFLLAIAPFRGRSLCFSEELRNCCDADTGETANQTPCRVNKPLVVTEQEFS